MVSRRIWHFAIIVPFLGFAVISCKTTQQSRTPIAKPPVADVPKPTAPPPLPVLPDTSAKPDLPIIQQQLVEASESLIARSHDSFVRGEKSLKSGFLEKAKKDIDETLYILFQSGAVISQAERLERHYEGLLNRIHNYELAALK